ncbi:MAG: TonB-dependent receptor [Sphingomonadales bacterium]|nr:TonB-dependent receptor [Sphingomonadales bacterium]
MIATKATMIRRLAFTPLLALLSTPAHAADDAPIIVTATPLSADADTVADSRSLRATAAASLAEQLARTAPGVSIADMSGNPLQADVSYHGFTASPLLGTPQGLSVWLDGVRLNQPFGEVMSWDLIPMAAVRSVGLVAGAAPQFGRNALGGVITLATNDGRSAPGLTAEIAGGSFGRVTASAQFGGHADSGLHWYLAADHLREDGWRAFSPSRATRAYGKLGWAGAGDSLTLSALLADTRLNGNGLQEMRLLAADRASVYTAPDQTRNRAALLALNGAHAFSARVKLAANLFWRTQDTATTNGDVNTNALGQSLYQPTASERAALAAAGYSGFPLAGETQANTPFPRWRCIANVLLNEEPNEKCNGLVNTSRTRQHEWGATLELTATADPVRLTAGLAFTHSLATFVQASQFGYLLPDRTVQPVSGPGMFADGTQNSETAFDARVDLVTRTTALGAYALAAITLAPGLRLDLAARYDRTRVHNRDAISPVAGPGSLTGDPAFAHLNPAASLDWQPVPGLGLTFGWSQASRAPSAIELGCSDPASPCRLPNALAGDPPLRQVIARRLEAKATLRRRHWQAAASLFRTDAVDDILFVTDDPSGFGYFRNFGKTRRQGIEVTASLSLNPVTLSAAYTLLDATYRSPETVGGGANSSSDAPAPGFDGSIVIAPGDPIPLLPRHLFKAALGWQAAPRLSLDLDLQAASGVTARGNENARHVPDGTYYLGPGRTDGYAVLNLAATFQPAPALTLSLRVRNLLDTAYATAAQLGPTAFNAAGAFVARPFAGPVIAGERPLLSSTFLSPAAPRAIEIAARLHFR